LNRQTGNLIQLLEGFEIPTVFVILIPTTWDQNEITK